MDLETFVAKKQETIQQQLNEEAKRANVLQPGQELFCIIKLRTEVQLSPHQETPQSPMVIEYSYRGQQYSNQLTVRDIKKIEAVQWEYPLQFFVRIFIDARDRSLPVCDEEIDQMMTHTGINYRGSFTASRYRSQINKIFKDRNLPYSLRLTNPVAISGIKRCYALFKVN